MKVIVRDSCGSQTLDASAVTVELDTPVRYRWECPLCLTERWGSISEVTAGILVGRGVKSVVPLTESEIEQWAFSARVDDYGVLS